MKQGDGLFMRIFYDVAKKYPMIEAGDMIVDNTCMQMVSNPHQFDVMVMPNLYGKSNFIGRHFCVVSFFFVGIAFIHMSFGSVKR